MTGLIMPLNSTVALCWSCTGSRGAPPLRRRRRAALVVPLAVTAAFVAATTSFVAFTSSERGGATTAGRLVRKFSTAASKRSSIGFSFGSAVMVFAADPRFRRARAERLGDDADGHLDLPLQIAREK
jgi:hypothetical protein